jgi:hypothetical protein
MIMIGLGIIGNYLAGIFDELKHRPISIVAEKIGFREISDGDGGKPAGYSGREVCKT